MLARVALLLLDLQFLLRLLSPVLSCLSRFVQYNNGKCSLFLQLVRLQVLCLWL